MEELLSFIFIKKEETLDMFFFVRHGQADNSTRNSKIYKGFGTELAPLTAEGIAQIKKTAKHLSLIGTDLILSSPYTRAVQTAAILSRELGAEVVVETDLHEWLPEKHYQWLNDAEAEENAIDYITNRGKYPEGEDRPWESAEAMKQRILAVLEKYKAYEKVIVVGHGMMIQAVTNTRHVENGEIVPFIF